MRRLLNFAVKLIATGIGTGYCPIIPGTIGSLLGVVIFFLLLKLKLPPAGWTLLLIILFFTGVAAAGRAEKLFSKKDCREIVIDEIAACILFLLFIPHTKWYIISAFIIFRVLDVAKPFPINDSQRLPGGWGIMVDDLIAGIYTALIVNSFIFMKGFIC